MEFLEAYSHALASLGGYAILMVIITALSAFGPSALSRSDCGLATRNYDDPSYRRTRAQLNAVETAGPFIAALLAAILTGGSPFWVNLFATLFLLARIATATFHIATTNQLARSMTWAISIVCVVALAIIGVIGAF